MNYFFENKPTGAELREWRAVARSKHEAANNAAGLAMLCTGFGAAVFIASMIEGDQTMIGAAGLGALCAGGFWAQKRSEAKALAAELVDLERRIMGLQPDD